MTTRRHTPIRPTTARVTPPSLTRTTTNDEAAMKNRADGNGGASDADTQPDDTEASLGPTEPAKRTGEAQAEENREDESPA